MSDPYEGDAGLVRVTDRESPTSMRIRITVDREACMSYVYLPTRYKRLPACTVPLSPAMGGIPVAVDVNRFGELYGVEIDGIIEAADIEDITGGER